MLDKAAKGARLAVARRTADRTARLCLIRTNSFRSREFNYCTLGWETPAICQRIVKSVSLLGAMKTGGGAEPKRNPGIYRTLTNPRQSDLPRLVLYLP